MHKHALLALALALALACGCGGAGGSDLRALVPQSGWTYTGTVVVLSAVEENGDPTQPFVWAWSLDRPSGSAAELTDPARVDPAFVPDVPGIYRATVRVSQGSDRSPPVSVLVEARQKPPDPPHVPPVVSLKGPASALERQQVVLDAGGSQDPAGGVLSFTWDVPDAPLGSIYSSNFQSNGSTATFTPQVAGSYRVEVNVTSSLTQLSSTGTVEVEVQPDGLDPVAAAGPDQDVSVGDTATLDATKSVGPPAAITSWMMKSRPMYSQSFQLQDDGKKATFVPDLPGDYVFTFTIAAGPYSSSDDVVVTAHEKTGPGLMTPLGHDVTTSAFSRSRDLLLLTSSEPRLYLLDPVTGTERAIKLPAGATTMALTPDGNVALVGHDAWLSVVDLQTAQVKVTWPVDLPVAGIATDGARAYLFPPSPSPTGAGLPHTLNLATGEDHVSTDMNGYGGASPCLHPDGKRLWTLEGALVQQWDVSGDTPVVTLARNLSVGANNLCAPLWISDDGDLVYSACGTVLRIADQGFSFGGMLDPTLVLASLAQEGTTVAALGSTTDEREWWAPGPSGRRVYFFNHPYLEAGATAALPGFATGGGWPWPSRGAAVYLDADDNVFVVATQAPGGPMPDAWGYAALELQ